jgi:hypothetical protein
VPGLSGATGAKGATGPQGAAGATGAAGVATQAPAFFDTETASPVSLNTNALPEPIVATNGADLPAGQWLLTAQATVNLIATPSHPGTITVQCELVSFSQNHTYTVTKVAGYNDDAADDAIPVSLTWALTVPAGATDEPGVSCAAIGSVTGSITYPATVSNGTLSAIQVGSLGS